MFDDLLVANRRYMSDFHDSGVEGKAARGLAVITCIDSRIDPLAMLGLAVGDAKILRNAGARVTSDSLRSLVLAVNFLRVTRVCVVQHTDCAMVGRTEDEIRADIAALRGVDATGWDFLATTDQRATLRNDIALIESCPLLPADLQVGAFIFDVHSGELVPADHTADHMADLPETIVRYLTAHRLCDADTAVRTFSSNATVIDDGKTYRGTDMIHHWLTSSATEYTYTTEVTGAQRVDDRHYVAIVHLEGNFPGATVDLRYQFAMAHDLIEGLTIEP